MKKLKPVGILRSLVKFFLMLSVVLSVSCGGDGEGDPTPPPPDPESQKVTITPSTLYQEMVGFGGALTWYSDRVINSTKKNEISDLIFKDLGTDIVRLKTWYYPDNYPTVKTTTSMSDDNSKAMWDVTNQLHQLAKARNPDIKILLSSWGPPAGLKSNNSSRQGTLKKDGANYLYDAYAEYWENLLNNLPFNPEYISIQNEPTYINAGWTTCQWSATETANLPGYSVALDKVFEKIQARANRPIIIGPESQDVPTFAAFAEVLKSKPHVGMYAYHPYNFNASSSNSQMISGLESIGRYSDKPNIMTEYSDNLSWFNTALFIHNTLVYANSSGYIYWKLAWAAPAAGAEDAAMISINNTGNYTVTPFYYLIKHYAKHIDAGYKRIAAAPETAGLNVSAFINPQQNKITLVIINNTSKTEDVEFEVGGKTISAIAVDQSKESDLYKRLENTNVDSPIAFPPQTISTVVLDVSN
jgi:glucuronoarabinoxylan endo-1,4-beta-xylanase